MPLHTHEGPRPLPTWRGMLTPHFLPTCHPPSYLAGHAARHDDGRGGGSDGARLVHINDSLSVEGGGWGGEGFVDLLPGCSPFLDVPRLFRAKRTTTVRSHPHFLPPSLQSPLRLPTSPLPTL